MQKPQLVILLSGSGSNLQAFIDQCQSGQLHADIACVISNNPDAFGLERAHQANIKTQTLDHKAFSSREAFDQSLIDTIQPFNPDLVVLAGFMRILTPNFVNTFQGKLINIHPSLLPKYPGLHTHQRALDNHEKHAGATVHFVTEELDGGPPILQASVPIQTDDTAATLAKRVLTKEHQMYPLAAKWCLEKTAVLRGNTAYYKEDPIAETGIHFSEALLT